MQLVVTVPEHHPSYEDHFPEGVIVPGVVLLELILQACRSNGINITSIRSAKFLDSPAPGTQLTLEIEQKKSSYTVIAKAADHVFLNLSLADAR